MIGVHNSPENQPISDIYGIRSFIFIWTYCELKMILILANLFLLVCSALPVNEASLSVFYGGKEYDSSLARRDTEYFTLRVMPLGASITQGYLSSDNNGYRKVLREQLRYSGWPVNMVGSLEDGTMLDNVCISSSIYAYFCFAKRNTDVHR
jgi:hypothetical protein